MAASRFRRVAALSAAGLIVGLVPVVAKAEVGVVTISPAAMRADGFAEDVNFAISPDGGDLKVADDARTVVCFNTGLNMPEGAAPIRLWMWVTRTGPARAIAYLSTLNLSSGKVAADAAQTDRPPTARREQVTALTSRQTIASGNQAAYGYAVCLGPGASFSGGAVEYEID